MSKHRCDDCGGTEDVRRYDDHDAPPWGWHQCRHCREALEHMEMRALAMKERHLLAEWGTLRDKRTA